LSDTINVKTICTDLNTIISLSGVCVVRSLFFCVSVLFCRSLFVLLSFFFWPLCCLSFDLRFLITPVVSSYSSPNGKKAATLIVRDGKGRHGAAKSKHSRYMRYESHVKTCTAFYCLFVSVWTLKIL